MSSSGETSPSSLTPCSTPNSCLVSAHPPKFGTVIPNRIFVGGIAPNTTEQELKTFFSTFGPVKDSKIIADRAGVSKGYGFITFETQEDADKIIKKEADNLIFKDRKLNIGPAVRKQVLQPYPRLYSDSSSALSSGAVLFTNGTPYTYQNGMAVFHAPSEGGYPSVQTQPQPAYPMIMSHGQPVYLSQYSPYSPSTNSQWAAAATSPAWRWATQSPAPAMTAGGQYLYPSSCQPMSPELMYAQPPPSAYQPTDMTDTSMMEAEGSMVSMEHHPRQPRTYIVDPYHPYSQPTKPAASSIAIYPKPVPMGLISPYATPRSYSASMYKTPPTGKTGNYTMDGGIEEPPEGNLTPPPTPHTECC